MAGHHQIDEPAFPVPTQAVAHGLSKREAFALAAMHALILTGDQVIAALAGDRAGASPERLIRRAAYRMADEMLEGGGG